MRHFFNTSLSAGVLAVRFKRILHPFIPTITMNLPGRTKKIFSPFKVIIMMLFSSIFLFLSKETSPHVVRKSMLEVFDNLGACPR